MNTLNTLIEDYTKIKSQFQKDATILLKEEFKNFFKEFPEIKVIKWTQYTPYFMDGDPCEFGVNEPTFSNADDPSIISTYGEIDSDDVDESIWAASADYGTFPKHFPKETVKKLKELSSMLQSSEMSEVLEATFGDHVVVTVTAKGIEVEEYEHD